MRLSAWLATRTFELTVHTLDIAAVTGIAAPVTPEALGLRRQPSSENRGKS
jgi:hypothetical protein